MLVIVKRGGGYLVDPYLCDKAHARKVHHDAEAMWIFTKANKAFSAKLKELGIYDLYYFNERMCY